MCERDCRLIAAVVGLLTAGWAQAASNRILFLKPASSTALDASAGRASTGSAADLWIDEVIVDANHIGCSK